MTVPNVQRCHALDPLYPQTHPCTVLTKRCAAPPPPTPCLSRAHGLTTCGGGCTLDTVMMSCSPFFPPSNTTGVKLKKRSLKFNHRPIPNKL